MFWDAETAGYLGIPQTLENCCIKMCECVTRKFFNHSVLGNRLKPYQNLRCVECWTLTGASEVTALTFTKKQQLSFILRSCSLHLAANTLHPTATSTSIFLHSVVFMDAAVWLSHTATRCKHKRFVFYLHSLWLFITTWRRVWFEERQKTGRLRNPTSQHGGQEKSSCSGNRKAHFSRVMWPTDELNT